SRPSPPPFSDSAVVITRPPVAQPSPPAGPHSTPEQAANGFEVPSIERYLPFLRQTSPEPAAEVAVPVEPTVEQKGQADAGETSQASADEFSVEGHDTDLEATASPELPEAASPPHAGDTAVSQAVRQAAMFRIGPKQTSASGGKTTIRRAKHARNVRPTDVVEEMNAATLWSLVPKHLQTLLALGTEEVAQNSYKRGFKESRLELIQRLLDPTLTLEETARLLNVCPTTVRRYTNRGLLTHQRTPGDQRRFKLSDVLAFLEAQSQGPK
ncbi:MAG TPA: helix-turn-helix domain-containing protein, partial [Chthonomonadales bacterium]|nr:helix-turn-helix domain-containing protein [Chthonomonadales bacterium]